MTENQAYVLLIVSGLLLFNAVCIGLSLLDARDEIIAMGGLLVAIGASFSVGLVGMHYDPDRRARKRR